MKIKIKKLHQDAIVPKYAHEGDACADVYSVSKREKENFIEYGTGLAFEVPKGYCMLVFPRSSVSDSDLMLKNSVGVLDSGYRGELNLRFQKCGEKSYNVGERIAQIMIIPYPKMSFELTDKLSETERGKKGLGSTGLK